MTQSVEGVKGAVTDFPTDTSMAKTSPKTQIAECGHPVGRKLMFLTIYRDVGDSDKLHVEWGFGLDDLEDWGKGMDVSEMVTTLQGLSNLSQNLKMLIATKTLAGDRGIVDTPSPLNAETPPKPSVAPYREGDVPTYG